MTEYGTYETVKNSRYEAKIHIDVFNSRVRLTEYEGDAAKITETLKRICSERGFGKIAAMSRGRDKDAFAAAGYEEEGRIAGYFRGEDACCMALFPDEARRKSEFIREEDGIISSCGEYEKRYVPCGAPGTEPRTAGKEDAEMISAVFCEVFGTYPTPMDRPGYVKKMMDSGILFKVTEDDGAIVSIASADMNEELLNAEITDCATLPGFRGRGYLGGLIYSLERELTQMGFIAVFSLARARSAGMNIALRRHGYEYSGRHINNCRIMSGFEDMNIWVKRLG